MRAVSPSSSFSSLTAAAVQRGHVSSLAVVDTSLLAAAHLADGRREHHLDPLHSSPCSSSSSSGGCLSISWRRRDEKDEDRRQKTAESRLQHFNFALWSEFLSALHRPNCRTSPPSLTLPHSPSFSVSLLLCGGVKHERCRKKGEKKNDDPTLPPSLFTLRFPLNTPVCERARGG